MVEDILHRQRLNLNKRPSKNQKSNGEEETVEHVVPAITPGLSEACLDSLVKGGERVEVLVVGLYRIHGPDRRNCRMPIRKISPTVVRIHQP